jgi:run domain Beclin-1 interacting cysteine-rich containing protein
MKYICKECVSDDYSIIPGFVIKKWDFKKFTVSKLAKKLLNDWYEKPIIYIKSHDFINKTSLAFRQANAIKQKINIIFDLMKCEKLVEFADTTLGIYKYLVLRHYLYSLKDFVDINEGRIGTVLLDIYDKFEEHITNCQVFR